MLKREWGGESNEKLLHLFIPSKTATLVPEFAVEDLPSGRTAALMSDFAVKDLLLAEHSDDDYTDDLKRFRILLLRHRENFNASKSKILYKTSNTVCI